MDNAPVLTCKVPRTYWVFARSSLFPVSFPTHRMRQQRWVPVLAVLNVLYMTRSTIRLLLGNQHAVTSLFDSPVVTFTASCLRGGAIDWIEDLMTTRTREFTLKVAPHPGSTADALHMEPVKLFAAPLIVVIRGQPGDFDLF